MRDYSFEHWTDEQLLVLIKQGIRAAEQALYQRYAVFAVKLASRFLGNRTDAEDIAQDAWLALHLHLKKHDPPVKFKPYFSAAVVNGCRKLLKRHHGVVSFDSEMLDNLEKTGPFLISTDHPELETQDLERLMRKSYSSLERLSELEHQALKLRYYDERPYSEIASTLNTTEGYARLIAHRALGKLRSGQIRTK